MSMNNALIQNALIKKGGFRERAHRSVRFAASENQQTTLAAHHYAAQSSTKNNRVETMPHDPEQDETQNLDAEQDHARQDRLETVDSNVLLTNQTQR